MSTQSPLRTWLRRGLVTSAMGLGLVAAFEATSTTTTTTGYAAAAPPPNILFLLDLSSAINQNCCSGMPCLEDLKKDILEARRHNDWANIGIVGTTTNAGFTYFPIAPLGSSPAEFANALSKVVANPTDTRNFAGALWAVTWQYLRLGFWGEGAASSDPISNADQQTHVITLTKALPNNDPWYYDSIVSYIYNSDHRLALAGTQNIVTHTIEVGGMDKSDPYSNAAKYTVGEGLYLSAITNEEVIAAISEIMRHIRTSIDVRSVALVNTDDGKVYATQYTLEHDGTFAKGDILQYEIDRDPNSTTYGQIVLDPDSPYNGALWSAGNNLALRPVAANEKNSASTRRIFTFIPKLLTCLPSSSTTVKNALLKRRMDLDAQMSADIAGTTCVDLFIKKPTYTACPDIPMDESEFIGADLSSIGGVAYVAPGSTPRTPIMNQGVRVPSRDEVATVSDGDDGLRPGAGDITTIGAGICNATFADDNLSTYASCAKDISKIKLDFGGGLSQSFTEKKKQQGTWKGTGGNTGKKLAGVWVTSADVSAQYFQNYCYPDGCGADLRLPIAGTVRDFTPSTNPDFERIIAADLGIVQTTIGADRKPVYNSAVSNPTITSAAKFNEWYNDVPGVNLSIPFTITLMRVGTGKVYEYQNPLFYPIDGAGFGNYGTTGRNYHFTYEMHAEFTYTGGEYFNYTGDDDLWVFINDKLAIDLGGVHAPASKSIKLDDNAATLGISTGNTYKIDFFYAERHTVESNLKISTTMVIQPVGTAEVEAEEDAKDNKVMVCHVPPGNPGNAHTIIIAKPALVNAHLKNHDGDTLGPCAPTDLTGDTLVDHHDVQALFDYTRGVETAAAKYLDLARGEWKLGDSPRSVPTIVRMDSDDFSMDPTYRAFAASLLVKHEGGAPDLVLLAANDGMLHAFDLDTGDELWAWVPAQVLAYDQAATWSGRLLESVLYGQSVLFDGTPNVEDVWIDANKDGIKAADGSEWRRIVVVEQGSGGPSTLILDITNPNEPQYLNEYVADPSIVATGQAVSRPIISSVQDNRGGSSLSVPVAITATGDAAAAFSPALNYASSEANIYIRPITDDYWGTIPSTFDKLGKNIDVSTTLANDIDGDGRNEQAYIAGTPAIVDVDQDGNADVMYFPVSSTYEPPDMGDVDGDGVTGQADIADPGYTVMYKAVMDPMQPDKPSVSVFFDPLASTGDRPEVYYAPTVSWLPDGSLGVYWGTGGPDNRSQTEPGYFFAMTDPDPWSNTPATPISAFGSNGMVVLGAGEILTWEPIVYAGVVYFVSYIPDCSTCTSGTSRIYGLEYDTGRPALDLNHDMRPEASYMSISGPIGSLNVSEQGVMFYGLSQSGVAAQGTISVGSLSLLNSNQDDVKPLTWADMGLGN